MKTTRVRAFLLTIVVALALEVAAYGQTNTFPSSGNVGIGTTTPAVPLEVVGTIRADGSFAAWGSGQLELQYYNSSNPTDQHFSELIDQDGAFTGRFVNDAYSAASNWLYVTQASGSYSTQYVTFPSGNVGIGTTTPGSPLEVRQDTSSATIGGRITINNFASASYVKVALDMNNTNVGSNDPQTRIEAADNADWSANLLFFTKNPGSNGNSLVERMRISSAGNVGIGTTDPAYPLAVNGTIEAKEVLVQTGWSDYVFDKGYRLAPVSEVEKTIATEGHLPGMPSAKEVAAHGVKMGEMEAKLLAQVEELTLRVIDQDKRLDEQASRVDQLEVENTKMRAYYTGAGAAPDREPADQNSKGQMKASQETEQ